MGTTTFYDSTAQETSGARIGTRRRSFFGFEFCFCVLHGLGSLRRDLRRRMCKGIGLTTRSSCCVFAGHLVAKARATSHDQQRMVEPLRPREDTEAVGTTRVNATEPIFRAIEESCDSQQIGRARGIKWINESTDILKTS